MSFFGAVKCNISRKRVNPRLYVKLRASTDGRNYIFRRIVGTARKYYTKSITPLNRR